MHLARVNTSMNFCVYTFIDYHDNIYYTLAKRPYLTIDFIMYIQVQKYEEKCAAEVESRVSLAKALQPQLVLFDNILKLFSYLLFM